MWIISGATRQRRSRYNPDDEMLAENSESKEMYDDEEVEGVARISNE